MTNTLYTGQNRPTLNSFINAIPLLQPLNDIYVSVTLLTMKWPV